MAGVAAFIWIELKPDGQEWDVGGPDGEGKHGYEPLDAAEETAGLLQDLQV